MITVVEPSQHHWYQPMWTMVGAGMYQKEDSRRLTKDYLPSRSRWIQDSVQSFQPDENVVTLRNGRKLHYETLIVASGLQIDWHKIPGLVDALEDASCPVASIYHYRHAEKAQRVLAGLTHGQAIFTVPVGGIKCGGAPQKIMWSWESNWVAAGIRPKIDIAFSYVPSQLTYSEVVLRTILRDASKIEISRSVEG
jgi:NADH dehydrogenase FAD-containing subunit